MDDSKRDCGAKTEYEAAIESAVADALRLRMPEIARLSDDEVLGIYADTFTLAVTRLSVAWSIFARELANGARALFRGMRLLP